MGYVSADTVERPPAHLLKPHLYLDPLHPRLALLLRLPLRLRHRRLHRQYLLLTGSQSRMLALLRTASDRVGQVLQRIRLEREGRQALRHLLRQLDKVTVPHRTMEMGSAELRCQSLLAGTKRPRCTKG